MSDGYYDIAQICENGHVTNSMAGDYPKGNKPYCDKCGSKTTTSCAACNTSIRGFYHADVFSSIRYSAPAYCLHCGAPFPWAAAALEAAAQLTEELEGLTESDKKALKDALPDLVRQTPRTALAESRFKRLMAKVGKDSYDAMRSVLTDVLSETIRKTIFGADSEK